MGEKFICEVLFGKEKNRINFVLVGHCWSLYDNRHLQKYVSA
jgi:hypothetical protein